MDSLRLLSPDRDGVRVRLAEADQRKGTVIQWARLPAELATCSALVIPSTVTFPIALSGVYLDNVDREFEFTVNAGGAIGAANRNRVVLKWANQFVSRTGRIDGEINLSNSGGLWRFVPGQGMTQVNGGFPMTLPYTGINAFAQAPSAPQILLAHLGTRGLWRREGEGDWARLNPEALPDNLMASLRSARSRSRRPIRTASSSARPVSTGRGLFVTADGGQTFRQFASDLDPLTLPNYQVTALTWAPDGTIYAAVRNLGVFVSARQWRELHQAGEPDGAERIRHACFNPDAAVGQRDRLRSRRRLHRLLRAEGLPALPVHRRRRLLGTVER